MNLDETETITIKLTRSPTLDGIKGDFLFNGMWVVLDDEHIQSFTSFKLEAAIDGDVKLIFENLENGETKTWIHEILQEDEILKEESN